MLTCPQCDSEQVTVTAEQAVMANTGEHYCHSVKPHDDNAKAECLNCWWEGRRDHLKVEDFKNRAAAMKGTR